jgi:pimeloyl-ACP methyl ester carboxylesterase
MYISGKDRRARPPGRIVCSAMRVRKIIRAIALAIVVLPIVVLSCYRASAARRETKVSADVAPKTGHFVHAADVDMFVQEVGPPNGPPVVLIHGTGAWSEIWRTTLDSLAAHGFRAIALDMPPFGFSERPSTADYSDTAQARRILGVINTLKLDSVTLVGHSFGGRPTMTAYFLDPSHVSRLVLVDVAVALDAAVKPSELAWPIRSALSMPPLRNALVSATLTNPQFTARLLRGLVADPNAVTPARVAMMQQPFVRQRTTMSYAEWFVPFVTTTERSLATERARYRTISVPTQVMWGDRDAITPISQGRDLARQIPGVTLVELMGVGHIPAIEAPEKFNKSLLSFLEQRKP